MATVTGTKRHLGITSDTFDSNGNVVVGGNLTINGTTTTLDTANLLVEDKNIIIGNVSTPSDTTADGGGITLKGASDYTINWINANNRWEFNQGIYSSGAITSAGQITGTELEGTSLDINGNADISGNLSGVDTLTATTLSVTNYGLVSGDIPNNAANTTGTAATATVANTLQGFDDRDVAPEDISFSEDLKLFFAEKAGIEGGTVSSDYQDLLVLNSYADSSGGKLNALAFDKSTYRMLHYNANYNATNWGTPKELAYTDSIPTDFVSAANGGTFADSINVHGNILLTGAATTTNQDRTIDFTGFDKEGTTDFSDRAYIRHTTNTGGHAGSVLVISSQNDAGDGIAFSTNASAPLKWNTHAIWTAGNDGASSGLDADLLDGQHGSYYAVANDVVTKAGAQTITGNKNFSNTGNEFNGHFYFNAYDNAGNHYPHFRDGSDNGGTTVNWRQYYGNSYKTHTWASDSSGNMTFTYQGAITAAGTLTGTSLDINGNAHISSQVTIDASGATDNYYMRFQEGGADRFYIYENSNNVYFNGGPGSTHFRPRQNGGTGNFVISGADFQTSANIQLGQYNTINWGSSTSNQLSIQNFLSGAGITQRGSGNLELNSVSNNTIIKAGNTERLRVHNGGNNGGIIVKGGSANWNETTPGTGEGAIHLDPQSSTDHFGSAITFGASDASNGDNTHAGIYTRSDGSYGTKMYFATTDSYAVGSKTRMFIDYNGEVGIGTTSPGEKLEVVGNIKHTGLTMTSGTDVDQVYSANATYQLSANTWTDTGINSSELATGTYAIQLFVDDHSAGGGHYDVVYSGMMSWYGPNTNSGNHDEIVLHRAGHATNSSIIQLRTLMHSSGGDDLMLQIKQNFSHSTTMSGTTDGRRHNFKFRRLI